MVGFNIILILKMISVRACFLLEMIFPAKNKPKNSHLRKCPKIKIIKKSLKILYLII
jgi:hypothetical protein